MKTVIEISKNTMDRLSEALGMPPIYDDEYGIDVDELSYAIKQIVNLCVDD